MHEKEQYFPSRDGKSSIRMLIWEPDNLSAAPSSDSLSREGTASQGGVRGIVQILHGMAEHIERYRDFAAFLTGHGYIVCGHDHIGHGKSVASSNDWGVMPVQGMTVLIEDAHSLRQIMQKRSETLELTGSPLPYIMFGHSMGSFVLRNYLALYGEGIQAAIICGTGQLSPVLSAGGSLAARFISATRGAHYKSDFLNGLSTGSYSKQIEHARTPLDWLSTDESVVDAYIAADDCGFDFSAGGIATVTALTKNMVKRKTVTAVAQDLPLLFIAGSEDPVGEKGEGVKRAVATFKDTGHTNVTLTLYEGMRHEVLNERGKEQVMSDILDWLEHNAPLPQEPRQP